MKIKIKSLIISTSFLLVLFCFSSASESNPYNVVTSEDFFQLALDHNLINQSQFNTISGYLLECPFWYGVFNSDFSSFWFSGTDKPNQQVFAFSENNNKSSGTYYLSQYDLSNSTYVYRFQTNINSGVVFGKYIPCSSVSNPYGFLIDSLSYTFDTSLNYILGSDFTGLSFNYNSSIVFYTDGYFPIRNRNNFINSAEFNTYYEVPETVSFISDERLKLSHIFGLGGIDELLINMSEFYTETGASPTSGTTFSDVTLTVEYTDFQDMVTTEDIVLSSSNSTITHSSYPSTLIHLVETPYSVFGNFEDYSKIEITGCSFTRTYNVITQEPQVDNFNIACSFVLKAATASSDLEPEEIDLPDYEDPEVVTQSQIEQIRQQLQEDSTAPNANSGDWSFIQDHPVVPSWADHYDFRVIYSDANSFVGNQVASNVWNYYTSNNPNGLNWLTSGFVPREFLHNNSSAMFYDMIIISVYEANVALAPDNLNILQYNNIELQGYLVFYSERYYIHRQALTQQDILSVLEYESYNDILYYTYVKEKLDDFENKTSLGLSKLIGLQGSTNSWLSSLDLRLTGTNHQLQQILTAINNIDIPEAPDLGEITDTLEYLFIPSFSWSTINYNEYLDSLGILSMPFRFGSSVFSGLENGYSPNLEYHLYEASVPLPASLGVSGNSFKLWDDQDFTLVTASIVPDQDLLANIRLFNLIICIMSQAFLTYLHIFRREGGVEDGI